MKKSILLAALIGAAVSMFAQVDFDLQLVASGFTRPVDIAHAGDGRLFIVEQRGLIKIIDESGQVLSTPFLNIDPRVNSGANERGLLGLAFHPDYANNGYFYVNYTNNSGHTTVSRFEVSAANPNVGNPDSELILLTVNQPYSNHNGGDLNFGPDGYLYIGMGDGGSGGDPQNYSQNRQSLLGKMLRIDVNSGSPYGIPADNPFVNETETRDEIWALGLRNPWRFSFDRQTGDMWIGDVGQNAWEEVDFQPASSTGGENYGWRCYEGFNAYNTSGCNSADTYVRPVHHYANSGSNPGCSVTGGYVYRGEDFPALQGMYIYADYCSGRMWSIKPDGQGGWVNQDLYFNGSNEYSSFGENHVGELFVATLSLGRIYRLVDRCAFFTVEGVVTPETCPGWLNGMIDLNLSAGEGPYTFNWSNEVLADSLNVYLTAGTYTVTVTDARGCVQERSFVVPGVVIVPPAITATGSQLSATPDFASYQWFLNGEAITGATEPNYTATVSGLYTVQTVTADGCVSTSEGVTVEVTNTLEALLLNEIKVSPNPFQEALQLTLATDQAGDYAWRLNSLEGRQVRQGVISLSGGSTTTQLDLSGLPAGPYLLIVSRNGQELSLRVQKQ